MRAILLAILMVSLCGLPAAAQFPGMRLPDIPAEFKMPPVGAWSEYRVVSGENDTALFKYSITGTEKCEGADCFWFELQVTEEEKNIVKMLVTGDPNETGNLKRLILKSGDEPAVEIPVAAIPARDDEKKPVERKETGQEAEPLRVGKETIDTPAGKIECAHFRVKTESDQADLWVNEKIPFFKLARLTRKDYRMEVLGYGDSGAKTAIAEKPKKMSLPGAPGERR